MSRGGALNRPSHAYVRVFLDEHTATHVNYRLIGADLAVRVYGSKKAALTVHYVIGDEREKEVRGALAAHGRVPPAPEGHEEPFVVLSGFGWKHIVEHDDPPAPAGQLFEMSRCFGTPSPAKVCDLWEMIEPGGAKRMLDLPEPTMPLKSKKSVNSSAARWE